MKVPKHLTLLLVRGDVHDFGLLLVSFSKMEFDVCQQNIIVGCVIQKAELEFLFCTAFEHCTLRRDFEKTCVIVHFVQNLSFVLDWTVADVFQTKIHIFCRWQFILRGAKELVWLCYYALLEKRDVFVVDHFNH